MCRGPLAWDVVSLGWGARAESPASGVETVLKAYDTPSNGWSWEALAPYIDARELQAVVWLQVLALRFPEPVSYTHLDVYKRQQRDHIPGQRSPAHIFKAVPQQPRRCPEQVTDMRVAM